MTQFTVRLADDIVDELDQAARDLGATRTDIVRAFCEEGLRSHAEYMDARRRDREAREYFAKFLVEKGIAKPRQVGTDSFFYGAAPALWLKKVERKLGAEVADEISIKMAEIMGRGDELEAYLADDSE